MTDSDMAFAGRADCSRAGTAPGDRLSWRRIGRGRPSRCRRRLEPGLTPGLVTSIETFSLRTQEAFSLTLPLRTMEHRLPSLMRI